MQTVGWKEEYNLGIAIIDNQHKRIVQIINNLYHSVDVENGPKILIFILDDLLEYTYYHFETEEPLLKELEDFDFQRHRSKHNEIIDKIILMKEEIIQGKTILSLESVEHIREWWLKHIAEFDKKAFQHKQ